MNSNSSFDVVVIGGGPAGLAAAISASRNGAKVLLTEREGRLGGILKQCIHDGFGLVLFNKKMAGPEYAQHYIDEIKNTNAEISLLTFVTNIEKTQEGFCLTLVTSDGIKTVTAKAIVFATGCRERTAAQVAIHGSRPAGVYTAGAAQYYTNILGIMPTKKCVILGSGDIGLIMARRLTLEGAKVLGVYEAKPTPSGLNRNISQCLYDFDIPLHTSHTVTKVFGAQRLEAVEISQVDENMQPIEGTQEKVECDSLILSVGLIPENEIAQGLGAKIDPLTKGPLCDQNHMTTVPGIFVCGNAMHVNDLVDYVTQSGECAGTAAANYAENPRRLVNIKPSENMLYSVPQKLNLNAPCQKVTVCFRSRRDMKKSRLTLKVDGEQVLQRNYISLRPPEMETLTVDFSICNLKEDSVIEFFLEEV